MQVSVNISHNLSPMLGLSLYKKNFVWTSTPDDCVMNGINKFHVKTIRVRKRYMLYNLYIYDMVKIVVPINLRFFPDQIQRLNSFGDVTYHGNPPTSPEEWFERCKDADIICPWMFGMKSDKVYDLKDIFISVPYVGVEFLDKNKLRERNIVVANAPWCNQEAVVEWIIGMILIYFRNLRTLIGSTAVSKEDTLHPTISLFNKEIAILWHGHIWTLLWEICTKFGMKVKFLLRGDDVITTTKNADIIANCLPLNDETKWLLDRNFFFSLKKWAFFISSSRNEIYDTQAMINAIDSGILIGAADDSASSIAWDTGHPWYKKLLHHPKIIVTPHVSWNTDYEKRKSNDMMIDNIEAWLNKKPINIIK